jgi:hypothetical protein
LPFCTADFEVKSQVTNGTESARWLLLIHQIPPKPDYFRVKIWRRLQNLGAVAIKNSVYALPNTEQGREDFEWVVREISSGGGEAMVCQAQLIEGLSDDQAEDLFLAARNRDYQEIAQEAKKVAAALRLPADKKRRAADERVKFSSQLLRLKRHLAEVSAIDFFAAPARKTAEERIANLEARFRVRRPPAANPAPSPPARRLAEHPGRTWVTRQGIHVDRMASAWLIQRFIDSAARFKFVSPQGYRPQAGEVRFDMFEAEFTHEGNRCTFEVLCDHFRLRDPALRVIAEIIHDIDLKESKYLRQETPGVSRLIAGISMNHSSDEARLERGCAVFDDLYECFRRQRNSSARRSASASPNMR